MSTELHSPESTPAASAPFCVIATVRPGAVQRVRKVLSAIQPVRVTATEATIWGAARELRYRGTECHVDETVVRLEIACVECQVDWIMKAIGKVLDADSPCPIRCTRAGSPSATLRPSAPRRVCAR